MTIPESSQDHHAERLSSGTARARYSEPADFSLISLLNVILRERLAVAGCALLLTAAVLVSQLTKPRVYASESAFVPRATSPQGTLSGLAAQFGVSFNSGGEGGQSSAFYLDLVRSREILGPVVETRYSYGSGTRRVTGTLADIYKAKGDSLTRQKVAVDRLAATITPTLNAKTGVIRLEVQAPDPTLAKSINARVLEELNRFNLQNRQSQATAERQFTEQRLAEVDTELQRSDGRLEEFLLRNREYRESPKLLFDYNRLAREVAHYQQIYTSVAQAYEQVKVEEVRDTPLLTVVEHPDIPTGPSRRGLLQKGAVALLLGGMIGLVIAFGRQLVRNARTDDATEVVELTRLAGETWRDIRHPLRALTWRVRIRAPDSDQGTRA